MVNSKRTKVCEICNKLFDNRGGQKHPSRFCTRTCYLIFHAHRPKVLRACLYCGKMLRIHPSKARNGLGKYCNTACRSALNRSKVRHCAQCGHQFTPVSFRRHKDHFLVIVPNDRTMCSAQCVKQFYQTNLERKAKIAEAFTGKNHPNWRGGTSYVRGPQWARIAEKVRRRQHYVCAKCGIAQDATGRKLDVDHVERYHNFTDHRKANRFSNLRALCHVCHMQEEQRLNVQLVFGFTEGPHGAMSGSRHYAAQHSATEILYIRELSQQGMSNVAIGKLVGAPTPRIKAIVTCVTYKRP